MGSGSEREYGRLANFGVYLLMLSPRASPMIATMMLPARSYYESLPMSD